MEQLHQNEMLDVEIKINQKESQRPNRAALRESGMDINMSNLEMSNNIFNNNSNDDNNGGGNNVEELQKKNEELENEIMKLRKDLELKEMDKSMVSKSELDKIENEKNILQSELKEEKEKNLKASQEILKLKESISNFPNNEKSKDIEKVKKYNVLVSYIKQVVGVWNPTENRDQFLLKKLKEMIERE